MIHCIKADTHLFVFHGLLSIYHSDYFVMWQRGPESLNWSWLHRIAEIDDTLFYRKPGWWNWWMPKWSRISPEWYDEPWKRYPHLM